jgi:hypothetical protein
MVDTDTSRMNIPTMDCQLRRRLGIPKNTTQARVAPAAAYQGTTAALEWARTALDAAVVTTARVEVWAVAPLMVSEAGERLHVAGSLAAAGLTTQVKATAPLNPPEPVTLMVEPLPVVAPALTVILPLLLRAKPGGTAFTVTVTALEVLPLKLLSPPYTAVMLSAPAGSAVVA